MPDYDVGAVSLSVPPASAVIQPYRPAVLVRNNGVHDALAVGSLRIYSPAGLLIFTTALYSGVIAPGGTQPAQGVDYWTPPALGRYMVIAYVSCINDQDPTNDNLAPCFTQIIAGPPTPPTPVQMHASQHEEGGGDELIIDGLHGRTADAQLALAHKASHQAAGADQLDVTGLPGILAQGQPIRDHHNDHEDGGNDELNVDELSGVLKNLQKPKVHGNESHDPNFALKPHGNADHDPDFVSVAVLEAHETAGTAHAVAENLEQIAHKGIANGYPDLNASALVPADQLGTGYEVPDRILYQDGTWKNQNRLSASIQESHLVPQGGTLIAIDHTDPLQPDGTIYDIDVMAILYSTTLGNTLTISVLAGVSGQALVPIATSTVLIAAGGINRNACFRAACQVLAGAMAASGIETDNCDLMPKTAMPTLDMAALGPEGIQIVVTLALTLPGSATVLRCATAALTRRAV